MERPMYRVLTVVILFFCFVTTAYAQDTTPDQQPEKTSKLFPIMLQCDSEPKKIFDVVQSEQYKELPFGSGKVFVRSAVTGQIFNAELYMLMNPDTRSFSLIGIFGDGTGCLMMTGNTFSPYKKRNDL